jgi:hypothetical protein
MSELSQSEFQSQAKLIVTLPDNTLHTMYEPTSDKHLAFHNSDKKNLIAWGNRGGGKALALNTVIPTPSGYTTMGDLAVGDKVFDENGLPCNVLWKSEPHIDEFGYFKLTFDDGTQIYCGGRHEWLTFDKHARDRLRRQTPEYRERRRLSRTDKKPTIVRRPLKPLVEIGSVVTTTQIAESLLFKTGSYVETNHAVRVANAWQISDVELPIHPYVLGVWLGDGSKRHANFTCADPFIAHELAKLGYPTKKYKAVYVYGIGNLQTKLRSSNLLCNKHIPDAYLLGSMEQRLALLQGLMDTDGNCELDGKAEFCNTNYDLARGVYKLTASLGLKPAWSEGRAKLYGRDCGPRYRVAWTDSLPVFRLPRKLERIKSAARIRRTQQFRFIVKAERITDEAVQCIQVDSQSHLYLCGEVGIPTHNSVLLRFDAHMRALSVPNVNLILVRRTYPELLRSHLIHIAAEMKMLEGDYNKSEHIAYYPNGSKLFFSHVASEADSLNLLSAEFLAAYFDELSTVPWDFFVKLCASVRIGGDLKSKGLIGVVRAATNPLGPSASEIFSYFVNKDVDPETDPDYDPNDWGAIKIQMEDNKYIDLDQYRKRFAGMPEYLKKAWLEGEFALENQLFDFKPKKNGVPYHVIQEMPYIGNKPVVYSGW